MQASRLKLPAGKNDMVVCHIYIHRIVLTGLAGDLTLFRLSICPVYVNVISQERIEGITTNIHFGSEMN